MNIVTVAKDFLHDEQGVTMVEYGLIAALIAIVAVTALTNVGNAVTAIFTAICTAINAPGVSCG
ncbi:Flp/Fap pilin component [mine drainage metagenome]|uniref:Flp/Fap pilin component n=1 Tax=mine drainage metagenome TaxID=410659 RepID=A0A1J5QNP4_9ZZZZ